jgi:uncharacterized membrane protein
VWGEPGARPRLGGSVLYLVGTVLITIAFHVPRNDALASVSPRSAEAAGLWARYLLEWMAWNHVRTAAAFLAAMLLMVARSE